MPTQYVYPSRSGICRIVRHGHRWRVLLDDREVARHETAETALATLRERWPQTRVPASLQRWRQLSEPSWSYSRPAPRCAHR
ncbi:MAG: hypothetical protein EPN74_02400 [Rhodanobacter sp.]|nr:MAG: hypothetical protein EPN74_02400 [Rhodanobacter sp.]